MAKTPLGYPIHYPSTRAHYRGPSKFTSLTWCCITPIIRFILLRLACVETPCGSASPRSYFILYLDIGIIFSMTTLTSCLRLTYYRI
ncbi:hypothetical protein F5Y04DRAFT_245112 [Hypomontagnella monticulosa]|nr:hypothetical protein F5Y04DRAFT_245112 [Hypomontagnella monticulosa]